MLKFKVCLILAWLFVCITLPFSSSSALVKGIDRLSEYVIYDDASFDYEVTNLLYNDQSVDTFGVGTWHVYTPDLSTVSASGMTFTGDWIPFEGEDPHLPGIQRKGFTITFRVDVAALSYHTVTWAYSGPAGYWTFMEDEGYFYGDGYGGSEDGYFETFTVNLTLPESATEFEILEQSSSYTQIGTDPIVLQWIEYDIDMVIDYVRFWGPNFNPSPGVLTGQVTDASSSSPIAGANVTSVGHPEFGDKADANGNYEFSLPPGNHQVGAEAPGYEKLENQVQIMSGELTQHDFAIQEVALSDIQYLGSTVLPSCITLSSAWTVCGWQIFEEEDKKITCGDHVHLFLPFKNVGGKHDNFTMNFEGLPNNGDGEYQNRIPGVLFSLNKDGPYETSVTKPVGLVNPGDPLFLIDVWMYVLNMRPVKRRGTPQGIDPHFTMTWNTFGSETVHTVQIKLSEIDFGPSQHTLSKEDCIHHPHDQIVRAYAQYLAGSYASWHFSDPDEPQAVAENVHTMIGHPQLLGCGYSETNSTRRRDDKLLFRQCGSRDIGACGQFTDLTISALRSVGIPTRGIKAQFPVVAHMWAEADIYGSWYFVDATNANSWSSGESGKADMIVAYGSARGAMAEKVRLSSCDVLCPPGQTCNDACLNENPTLGICVDCKNIPRKNYESTACYDDVTDQYQASSLKLSECMYDSISLSLSAPVSVTQLQQFPLQVVLNNTGTQIVQNIFVSVSQKQWASDSINTYNTIDPDTLIDFLLPGEADTLEWQITPMIKCPFANLLCYGEWQDCYTSEVAVQNINEANTNPDLILLGSICCDDVTVQETVSVTTVVYDDSFNVEDEATLTGTAISLYDSSFEISVNFTALDSSYAGSLFVPVDAPLGPYTTKIKAEKQDFDPDSLELYFSVMPTLQMDLQCSAESIGIKDPFTLSVVLTERESTVTEAQVSALLTSPGDSLHIPLDYDSIQLSYRATFTIDELLGQQKEVQIQQGEWNVLADAEYFGGRITETSALSLLVSDLSIRWNHVYLFPDSPQESTFVNILTRINNLGDYSSDSTIVRFYLDGLDPNNQIGADLQVPPIAPDSFFFTEMRWFSRDDIGTHTVYVMVDPESTTIQSSRRNDLAEAELMIAYVCGDADGDTSLGLGDVVYLLNYIFRGGPEPQPRIEGGDVNLDTKVDIVDVVYLINYMFRMGPAPCSEPPRSRRYHKAGFIM